MHWLTVELHRHEKPKFIAATSGCPTAWILSRLITAFAEWCRNESTSRQYCRTWQRLISTWAGFHLAIDQWQKDSWQCIRMSHWTVALISLFSFHDCIKHVKSLTFLTSSYCCRRLKYVLQISQGSVVTVLRWWEQN